jgi:phosphopentomutase
VFERIGDVREKAVAMGKIADIFEARGQLDEALRVRNEEEMPVYERLGDVREIAVILGKIADIFQARGQLNEALRIRTEEQLPVFVKLGDVRSKAVTMGRIADIFEARGQLDEALRIRTEEEMPVFERLGDVREKTVTMGKIANVFQARGQLNQALALHEERLPLLVEMESKPDEAHTKFSIAQIWLERGDHLHGKTQAIAEYLVDAFLISEKSGQVDAVGAIGKLLAQVLAMDGAAKEALKVLAKARAAFEQLGNSKDVAQCEELRSQIQGSSAQR